MQEIARKLNILYNSVYFYFHRKEKTGSNQSQEKEVWGSDAQQSKRASTTCSENQETHTSSNVRFIV